MLVENISNMSVNYKKKRKNKKQFSNNREIYQEEISRIRRSYKKWQDRLNLKSRRGNRLLKLQRRKQENSKL